MKRRCVALHAHKTRRLIEVEPKISLKCIVSSAAIWLRCRPNRCAPWRSVLKEQHQTEVSGPVAQRFDMATAISAIHSGVRNCFVGNRRKSVPRGSPDATAPRWRSFQIDFPSAMSTLLERRTTSAP